MSQDTLQESLFEDPIGLRFRGARERLRWSIEAAAQQLKLPKDVLEAIEREDWARLGPAIYARSYLTSYARLLGLPAAIADEAIRGRQQPDLVSNIGSVPRPRRLAARPRGAGRAIAIVVVLLGLAVAAWALGLPDIARRALGRTTGSAPVAAPASPAPPVESAAATGTDAATSEPVALPAGPAVPSAAGDVVLRFRGDSWVEVLAPDGATVERGLVAAGTERRFARGAIGQVTLGDAAAVDVSQDGATIDLGPGNAAKVARFTVSSDGSIHPSALD